MSTHRENLPMLTFHPFRLPHYRPDIGLYHPDGSLQQYTLTHLRVPCKRIEGSRTVLSKPPCV